MKVFVHLHANNQGLRPSSFWVLGGFVIISLLSYFAGNHSESDISLGLRENINSNISTQEDLNIIDNSTNGAANVLLATSIGDYAWIDCDQDGIQDDDELPLAFVPVNLSGTLSTGQSVNLNTTTNANGWYVFEDLEPGKYQLTFGFPDLPTGLDYTLYNQTSNDLDSDVNPNSGMTNYYTIEIGDIITDIDAGFIDVAKPIFEGIPGDVMVACDAIPDPPVIGTDITATDNLDDNVEIIFSEEIIDGSCQDSYTIKRTWTAMDDCGNSKTVGQIITVEDDIAPELIDVPTDLTIDLSAGETIPNVAQVTGIDDCDDNVTIEFDENSETDNCETIITRTWTAFDNCGHSTTESQTITVLNVCNCGAIAGSTIPTETTICYAGGTVAIAGMADGNAVVPTGFSILYILSNGGSQDIQAVGASPEFTASEVGVYTIHAFVFDPSEFSVSTIQFGITTIADIFDALEQGGGSLCGAIEIPGTPITVVQADAIIQTTSPDHCDLCDGTAILTPASYDYLWSDGGTGASRQDLCDGSYEVTATDPLTGCTDELTVIIAEDCGCTTPQIVNLVVVEAACGTMTATANIELAGDNSDYDYEWSPNSGTSNAIGNSRTNLSAGAYTVTITDAVDPSCFLVETFTIGNSDGPAIEMINTSPATCNDANATAIIVPPFYDYDWSDGESGSSRVGLLAGIYQVTVTDPTNGCFDVTEIIIDSFNPLSAEVEVSNASQCDASDGEVTLSIVGGSGDYTVDWSDGGNGESRDNLAAGFYSFTVTDNGGAGCVIEDIFILENAVDGGAGIIIINEPIMASCAGAADGTVDYSISFEPDFEGPETIVVLDASGELVAEDALSQGSYCIVVRDANGCVAGQTCFEVSEPDLIDVDIVLTNVDCDELGAISLEVTGGNGVYDFDWQDLNGTVNPQDRTDLGPGNYNLTITDINGCSVIINDLVIVDVCEPCPSAEIVFVELEVEDTLTQCIDIEDCFEVDQTVVELLDGGLNGSSAYGTWTLSSTGCLTYESGMVEGSFVDTVYTVATFNGLADTTCFIVSIATMSLNNPSQDTINITTEEEVPYSDCIPLDELDGDFASIDILYGPLNMTGTLTVDANSPCFTYTPDAGQTGNAIDTMAVIICDDLGICDTTIIVVSINPSGGCPDIIFDETVEITVFECFEFGFYCLPVAPPDLFNYQITDNGQPYFQGFVPCDFDTLFVYSTDIIIAQVPTGPYQLVDWTENGETHSIASFEDLEELVDSMNVWDPAGNWMLRADNKIEGGTDPTVYGLLEIDQIDAPFNNYALSLNILPLAGGSQIGVDTGYHEIILDNIFTGCSDTLILEVECINVFCPEVYSGPTNLMAVDCDSLTEICLDIATEDLIDYTITDNGLPYSGIFNGCNLDSLVTYFTVGYNTPNAYTLDSWEVNGQMFSIDNFMTLSQLVDSMNVWDPAGNWSVQGLFLMGGDFSNDYGNIIVSQGGVVIAISNPNLELTPNSISIQLDTGFHELILTDTTNGCIKTVELTIGCIPFTGLSMDTTLTVFEGMVDTFCLDVSGVNTISSIINVCPDDSDGNVGLMIIPGINCVEYTGDLLGVDTFCIEVCDAVLGICDTTNIVITVLPTTDTIDLTLLLGFSDTICLDTTIFQNQVAFTNNFTFFDDVDFFLNEDEYCAEIMGIDLGMDTLCLLTCDVSGFCDTTYVFVDVIPQTIDTIVADVIVGVTDTICIDTTELAGTIISINNYCLGESGTFVDFDILDDYCISFEGLVPNGTDTACIEICDEFGYCDTTIFVVTAIPNGAIDPPIAIDDDTTTILGTPVIINVLGNDILNSTLIDIGIVDGPNNGSVVINTDFSISYIPDQNFCGELDSFTYFITTLGGSDTATVIIDIQCDELTIYNGISPNGDEVNDVFNIIGIENFPDNTVYIFNRWGNQVFLRKGYTNNDPFDGTWEGKTLPDGTYFYLIEVKGNEGQVMKFNGYLQIHR